MQQPLPSPRIPYITAATSLPPTGTNHMTLWITGLIELCFYAPLDTK